MRVPPGFSNDKIASGVKPSQARNHLFATYSKVGTRHVVNPNYPLAMSDDQLCGDTRTRPVGINGWRRLLQLTRADFQSKINDGLTPAFVLILLTVMYDLIAIPVERAFELHGLLIFILLLLTLGAVALDRCIDSRYTQTERVFHGMLAGMFFWFTASAASLLGLPDVQPQANVIYMLLAAMVAVALWRTVLPIGAKFFALVFLFNWIGRFLISRQLSLFQSWDFLTGFRWTYGWIALAAAALLLAWLFFASRRQAQRSWAALGIWFFVMTAASLFLGWTL